MCKDKAGCVSGYTLDNPEELDHVMTFMYHEDSSAVSPSEDSEGSGLGQGA